MDRHRRALTPRVFRVLRVGIPVAFLAVFFVYPVASIIGRGIAPDGKLDLTPLREVLTDPELRRVAWFTVWQACVSTVLTLVVALPGAYVVARYDFPGRRLVRALVTIPFVLPTIVVATAFLALLGPNGPLGFLGWERGLAPILLAHVFFNYAVVLRTVGNAWANLDPAVVDVARVLGASRWRAFREVTLPLLAPSIAAAASIVFLFTFTSFGVVLLLGGPGRATLEVEIYRQTALLLDLPTAAALAIVQMTAITVMLVVLGRVQERRGVARRLVAAPEAVRRPRTRWDRAVVTVNLAVMALLLGGPLAVLVARSLRAGGGWGFGNFRGLGEPDATGSLLVPPGEAVRNSVLYALAATLLAVGIGGMAAAAIAAKPGGGARSLDVLLMLPLGTSAVTIGFGFLIALDDPPLDLRTSPALIVIAHAIIAIPFVVRVVVPALRAIDPRLRDAAAVLGASPGRVWREVDLPIVARAYLVAAGFAAAVSLGEFGATVFIARPDVPTVPVAIYRYLGRPGAVNFGRAMALSVVLMLLTAVAVVAIERVRVRDVGEF